MQNAYWQVCVEEFGIILVKCNRRLSPGVAGNLDMCYDRSTNGSKELGKSTSKEYDLPINASTAEYACRIP
jgi:hypothetical protein